MAEAGVAPLGRPEAALRVWRERFWWQWIAANALAELIGLGLVAGAGAGAAVFGRWGEPSGLGPSLGFAAVFVALGAAEGAVVGLAQRQVLRTRLPRLRGWVTASVVGAVAAWGVGMVPSTLMRLHEAAGGPAPDPPGLAVTLLLAAGLGAAAGPMLAVFQWICLRRVLRTGAAWWLPANAAAWAVGMPIIFAGAQVNDLSSNKVVIVAGVALALAVAGAAVGAVHGAVMAWLLRRVST
jgi:hypothetical protein